LSDTNKELQCLRAGQYYQTLIVELLMDERGTVRRTLVVHVLAGAEERSPAGTRCARYSSSSRTPAFHRELIQPS
jgi:hypothetical protein